MKKIILGLMAAALLGGAAFGENINDLLKTKKELRFNKDGKFRVLVLSDIHATEYTIPANVQANIKYLVDAEKPDLVIFNGDTVRVMYSEEKLRSCFKSIVGYIEQKQIPWAHVYGNHDHEHGLSKEEQQKICESFEWCVTERGPTDIDGVGNCVLPVYSSKSNKIAYNVWLLDSGHYIAGNIHKGIALKVLPFSGSDAAYYDFIKFNQIKWYVEASEMLEKHNGAKIPGLMAFHIPLQESYFAWQNKDELEHTGSYGDNAIHGPAINSGLFAAILGRGDIKAIVNGHDHKNDFMVKYVGVKLCFASTPSTLGYHSAEILGGRVFVMDENKPEEIETYMSYINKPRETVKVTKAVSSKAAIDFEKDDSSIKITGLYGEWSDLVHKGTIKTKLVDGKGVNGSKALEIMSTEFLPSAWRNNFEARIGMPVEKAGLVGEAKYMKFYMDLTGVTTAFDFRKASAGFYINSVLTTPCAALNNRKPSGPMKFYYKAEGSTEWKEMTHGDDSCFGAHQGSSVNGFKGWFAFPIADMRVKDDDSMVPTPKTPIYGAYFYIGPLSQNMANNPIYIDHIYFDKDL
ncbi:MAG: metallophosphoesterase [Kiritimatiellae bacterium]|nr:metallophosphoesterase [Kiritimatiellia bacterium]